MPLMLIPGYRSYEGLSFPVADCGVRFHKPSSQFLASCWCPQTACPLIVVLTVLVIHAVVQLAVSSPDRCSWVVLTMLKKATEEQSTYADGYIFR